MRSLEGAPVAVASGRVLEVDLAAVTGEGPAGSTSGPCSGAAPCRCGSSARTIDAAAEDDDVVAIRMVLRGSSMGWASAEEVLAHLDAFRESGKPIYVLLEGDILDDLTYFLATAADQVWIAPATAAAINGLAVESPFFRGTLDKLHIVPEVIMMGNYKSAGEPFLNYEMSPYMRESLQAVLETTRRSFVERVAARREREAAAVESALERTVLTARDVIEAGFADEIGYVDQVEAALVEATGIDEYRGIDAGQYWSARESTGAPRFRRSVGAGVRRGSGADRRAAVGAAVSRKPAARRIAGRRAHPRGERGRLDQGDRLPRQQSGRLGGGIRRGAARHRGGARGR